MPKAWYHVGGFGDILLLAYFVLGFFRSFFLSFPRKAKKHTYSSANAAKEEEKKKEKKKKLPFFFSPVEGYAHYFAMTLQFFFFNWIEHNLLLKKTFN